MNWLVAWLVVTTLGALAVHAFVTARQESAARGRALYITNSATTLERLKASKEEVLGALGPPAGRWHQDGIEYWRYELGSLHGQRMSSPIFSFDKVTQQLIEVQWIHH